MPLIPATIITGYLGSGKTTLLKRLLMQAHCQKLAVIENEFGEENIDGDILLANTTDNIIQMSNGCICCSIRDDLRTTMVNLAKRRSSGEIDFNRLVIETTGLADPGPVAQTFFASQEIAEKYRLDAIVTLVDAKHAEQQLSASQEARRQVGFADQIFLSKADLVPPEQIAALTHRLKLMNPRALIRAVHFGDVELKEVFELSGFRLNAQLDVDAPLQGRNSRGQHVHDHDDKHCNHPSHRHHHADDVESFVYRAERPFNLACIENFLGAVVQVYGPSMLRYKGVLCLENSDHKLVFQGVHQLMGSDVGPAWADGESRVSKMVFIGIALPRDILVQGLGSCLV